MPLKRQVNNINTTDTSNLVKKTDYETKIKEIKKRFIDHDHAKYVTTTLLLYYYLIN